MLSQCWAVRGVFNLPPSRTALAPVSGERAGGLRSLQVGRVRGCKLPARTELELLKFAWWWNARSAAHQVQRARERPLHLSNLFRGDTLTECKLETSLICT